MRVPGVVNPDVVVRALDAFGKLSETTIVLPTEEVSVIRKLFTVLDTVDALRWGFQNIGTR